MIIIEKDNMNNHYFFYINHLVTITAISLLPYFSISSSSNQQASVEQRRDFNQKIAPHKASQDDSIRTSVRKQIGATSVGIVTNYAFYKSVQSIYPPAAAAIAPSVFEQISRHNDSRENSRKIEKKLTDERGYQPSRSTGEFNQQDWDDRLELAEIELSNLQSSLIDQELDNYIEDINQKIQQDIAYNKTKGYKFDPNTQNIRLHGGKSIPAKDALTEKGFKELGLSSEEFKKFKKQQKTLERQAIRQGKAKVAEIIKSAKNKAKRLAAKNSSYDVANQKTKSIKKDKAINNRKNQGINGYGYSSFDSNWRPPSFQDILNQQKLLNKGGLNSDSKNELTMLSKQYGNDLIGLPSNNIFDMIHRQYLRKRSQLSNTTDLYQ